MLAQLSDSEQDNLIQVGQDDSKFSTEVGYKIEERINYLANFTVGAEQHKKEDLLHTARDGLPKCFANVENSVDNTAKPIRTATPFSNCSYPPTPTTIAPPSTPNPI